MSDPDRRPDAPDTPGPEDLPADAAGAAPDDDAGPQKLGLQAKLIVAAVAVLALAVLFWPRGDGATQAPGGFLTDAAGRPQTLGPRMAPVTLVHFWATWCAPCLTEVPALDRLQADLGSHPDFRLLMIAVDDEVEKVQTFLGNRSTDVLFDPSWDVAHRYGTRKLPETYLVVDGRVVEKWEGAQDWDDPDLRRQVREAVEGLGGADA